MKKQPWTNECIEAVLNVFEKEINSEKSTISGKKIIDLICSTPCLKTRTPAQIRTWIHNKRKTILNDSGSGNKSNKRRNTVPSIIYTYFEKNIQTNIIPTVEECVLEYSHSPSLKKYSPIDIQHLIKKAIEFP